MKRLLLALSALCIIAFLNGCDAGPGFLEGTWTSQNSPIPITISFRPGETESIGVIEQVDYEQSGDAILIKYKSGMMKGTAFRFSVVDANTITSQLGIFKRIK